MRSRHNPLLFMALVALGPLLGPAGEAWAFDDADCLRVVPTIQHRTFDLRPGEPVEMARIRAIDELDKLAVFEVVGVDVQASRADDVKLDNESTTRHGGTPAFPGVGETGEDRTGVASHFQDVIRSSYRGLVRIKLTGELPTGVSPHQGLDITAEVTVCQPKPEAIVALDREKAARDRMPPHIVDPDKAIWFDPMTGEPRIWYWAGQNDAYTFFDKSGFDPMTGDQLRPADRPFLKSWKSLVERRKKDALDAAAAQLKKAELQRIRDEDEQRQAQLRAAQDAKTLQACDDEAANPGDPRKPTAIRGARWDDLKIGAAMAAQDCEAAVRLKPAEPRLRYQFARAMSVNDPRRALLLFKRLVEDRYPAAYDNYGWALLDRRVGRDDLAGALKAFDDGVEAGDPDAMVSLAGLIADGRTEAKTPDEALRLYRRAAGLGSAEAGAAVARLEAEQAQAAVDRARAADLARQQAAEQERAGQLMLGVMGGVLRNVGRR